MDCPSSQMKEILLLFHKIHSSINNRLQRFEVLQLHHFIFKKNHQKITNAGLPEIWLFNNLKLSTGLSCPRGNARKWGRWCLQTSRVDFELCPLPPCSTSTEPGLQGTTLFSLLKSLFNDLSLVVIGDLSSSSEVPPVEGDKDEKFSAVCLGMSITNIPSGPLPGEAQGGWEEAAPSSKHNPAEVTRVWFPQNKMFVG